MERNKGREYIKEERKKERDQPFIGCSISLRVIAPEFLLLPLLSFWAQPLFQFEKIPWGEKLGAPDKGSPNSKEERKRKSLGSASFLFLFFFRLYARAGRFFCPIWSLFLFPPEFSRAIATNGRSVSRRPSQWWDWQMTLCSFLSKWSVSFFF